MHRMAYFLLLCIVIYLKSVNSSESNGNNSTLNSNDVNKSNICTTQICAIESARMLSALNDSIDPCDDFYDFACGKLIRNTWLPETKDSQTVFSAVQEIVDAQIKSILITELESNESNATKLANIFAKSCIMDGMQSENGKIIWFFFDVSFRNFKFENLNLFRGPGIKPMVEILEKYTGGWPVVKGDNWRADNWNWINASQHISNGGLLDLILDWGIGVDSKNSTRNVLIVSFGYFNQEKHGS